MYTQRNEAELNAFGLTLDDFDDSYEVWPECWESYRVFDHCNTQWNHGFNGVVGLRYESLSVICSAIDVKLCEDLLIDIRILELAAMREINSRKGK